MYTYTNTETHLDVGQCVFGVVRVVGQVGLDLDVEVFALFHYWIYLLQKHALQLNHLSLLLLAQVGGFLHKCANSYTMSAVQAL
jgi:hypothetical protein